MFLLTFRLPQNKQSNKMSTERQPLLMDVEVQGRSSRPRPDIRESPESTLVDVKNEDAGK